MTIPASTTVISAKIERPVAQSQERITAIDALRGVALTLMALTHAAFFIGVGMQAESYGGQPVYLQSPPYWLSGLLTTLASPIFFCVAGVSLALLEQARIRKGASNWAVSRFILARAGVIMALDLTVCAWLWLGKTPYVHVLTAMGLGMIVLAGLRLLPTRAILAVAVGTLLAHQGIIEILRPQLEAGAPQSLAQALFLTYSYETQPPFGFPLLGWGPVMWLGFVLGRSLSQPMLRQPRTWVGIGAGLLALWLVLRLIGGYGDLGAYRAGDPLPQFLVMSKAPPSLSYLAFKLGIAALIYAALLAFPKMVDTGTLRLLTLIGQTSLFFYVLHIVVYHLLARAFFAINVPALPGIVYGYALWALGMLALAPLCGRYR
ncbi:MAG: heparan-alpha-glucosaminide N-acetyltransferase domain-containing protein, partial [Roseiflexaceae bacterium]|nr:heparan-alpha-glucosaminide N-acetyltransferase domain-containing protein [Roseiflexaceae bacterium]